MENYYDLLGVSATASLEEIRKATIREQKIWAMRANSPQKDRRLEAENICKIIEEAKEVLLNPDRRSEYDKNLRSVKKEKDKAVDAELIEKVGEDLVQEAWDLLIAGNIADALAVATKATQIQSRNPEAWAVLGQAKLKWNELEDAVQDYRKAIQLKPNESSYYFDLGNIYESEEKWADALREYQRAATIDPQISVYRAAIGSILIRTEKYREGIEILEKCVQEEPDNSIYQWFLALAYHDSTISSWWKNPENDEYYCISEKQADEASEIIKKAKALKFDDDELLSEINKSENLVKSLYKRKFKGSWILVILWGFVYIIPGVLWWLANLRPRYLINKDLHDIIEKGKKDSLVGGEAGIYYSALPPGFRWAATKYPRYIVWILILVLSPITLLYSLYDNYKDALFGRKKASLPNTGSVDLSRQDKIETPDIVSGVCPENMGAKVSSYEIETGIRPGILSQTDAAEGSLQQTQLPSTKSAAAPTISPIPPIQYPSPAASPITPPKAVPFWTTGKKKFAFLFLIVGIGFLVYSLFLAQSSFTKKIDSALIKGNYFSPSGDNVEEIYKSQLAKSPNSKKLKDAATRIYATYKKEGDAALQRLYVDSDDSGWDGIAKMYSFLSEIIPEDKEIMARTEFSKAHNILKSANVNDFTEALKRYNKALELKPNWVFPINGIAKVYILKTSPYYNKDEALVWYNRASEVDPNFPWAYSNIAAIRSEELQWALAEQALLKAVKIKSNRPSFYIDLGNICEKQQKQVEAKNYYQEALKYEKNSERILWLQKKISSIK